MTDPHLERRYATAEFRFAASPASETKATDSTTAGGYIAVFNSESFDLGGFKEIIAPGAFKRSLNEIANGTRAGLLVWQHDVTQILASVRGKDLILSEDNVGLAFEFDLSRATPQQAAAIRAGDLQCSFGFYVREDTWQERADGSFLRTITDLDLIETTICTFPAYGATSVALRSLEAWKSDEARANASTAIASTITVLSPMVEIEEQPQENTAIKIKRALMLKAIEQHIRGLPAA